MKIFLIVVFVLVLLAIMEYAIAVYFFKRTMIRSNAKREKTQEMAETDWDRYIPHIRECKAKIAQIPHEDLYITSNDGLKLHATYFPCEGSKKL